MEKKSKYIRVNNRFVYTHTHRKITYVILCKCVRPIIITGEYYEKQIRRRCIEFVYFCAIGLDWKSDELSGEKNEFDNAITIIRFNLYGV